MITSEQGDSGVLGLVWDIDSTHLKGSKRSLGEHLLGSGWVARGVQKTSPPMCGVVGFLLETV